MLNVINDTHQNKFTALKVNLELETSIFWGLINLSRSETYLQNRRTSDQVMKISLIYNIETLFEQLNMSVNALRECIILDILDDCAGSYTATKVY